MSLGGFIRRSLYWTNDYLHGSPVGKHYREIRKILNNKEKGEVIQEEALNMEEKVSTDECVKELKELLGNGASITVELVNEIPILASGKRKPVLQEWKK